MSFAIADRVRETTATTGTTSPLNLAGAWPQFQSFVAGVGSGNNCEYALLSGDGTSYEIGIGTVTSGSPNTLSRDTVLASSNSNALISLTGTSTVFLTRTAASYRATLGAPVVPPPVAASWTARNSATITNVANGVQISAATVTTGNIKMATLAVPATPYNIDMNLIHNGGAIAASYNVIGAGWTDGTKVEYLQCILQAANAFQVQVAEQQYSNFTTGGTGGTAYYPGGFRLGNAWIRLADDGTNASMSFSADGVTYIQAFTVAKSGGYLGSSGYSNVGFLANAIGGATGTTQTVTLCSWWVH